jgi:hypothetical protein
MSVWCIYVVIVLGLSANACMVWWLSRLVHQSSGETTQLFLQEHLEQEQKKDEVQYDVMVDSWFALQLRMLIMFVVSCSLLRRITLPIIYLLFAAC